MTTHPDPKPMTDEQTKAGVVSKPQPSYAPIYAAALYPQLATIARKHGYALAVHGSLQRDFDLIAVPWIERPNEPEVLIEEYLSTFDIKEVGGPPSEKPHGRRAWTLAIGFGTCAIDLSFMPSQWGILDTHRSKLKSALDVWDASGSSAWRDDSLINAGCSLAERVRDLLSTPQPPPEQAGSVVPDGYVLVPKIATKEMLEAGRYHSSNRVYPAWGAMLSAAPAPKETP